MNSDASDMPQDVSPFLKDWPKEAEKQEPQHLPRVCEERGFLYRDPVTGIRAKLMSVRYSPRCDGCGRKIPEHAQALGVSPKEERNKSGRWVFGCLECAQNSTFESTRAQSNLFPKREEG